MRYQGPIYRPPSEADSLLIQATVGCPHNRCTFCMVYKDGTPFKVRPLADIIEDLEEAARVYGDNYSTLFFPAGNSIAMKTEQLATICQHARQLFPKLRRITVYGSFQYLAQKGLDELVQLKEAGLSRIHAGLESGDDITLERIKKGTTSKQQLQGGRWALKAGIELSTYVLLGIGGADRSRPHAMATAAILNEIQPTFIRLRTFLPKKNTPILKQIENGSFIMLGPHEVLLETKMLIEQLTCTSLLTSDHYTNYVNLHGQLPSDKEAMLSLIQENLKRDVSSFRPIYIGNQ